MFIVKIHAAYPITTESGAETVRKTEIHAAENIDVNCYSDRKVFTLMRGSPQGSTMVILPDAPVPSVLEDYEVTDIFIENHNGKTLERYSRSYGSVS